MATLGKTSIGGSTNTLGGEMWACKFTPTEAGSINSINAYLDHTAGNDDSCSVAVYLDNGSGAPGDLLCRATSEQVIDGAGAGGGAKWYTFSSITAVDGITFDGTTDLWLTMWPGFAGIINAYYDSGSTDQTKISTNYETWWTWRDPFGTVASSFAREQSIYIDYTPLADIEQEGFAFGDDDGNEASHTLDTQDTNITEALGTKTLRVLLNTPDDPGANAYKLKYQKNGTGGYLDVPIGASSSPTLSYGSEGALAYSTSGGTSVAPAYPTGITANSCLVLVIGQKPSSANGGTVTTPSGWTLRAQNTGATDGDTGGYTTTLGADTGNTNIYVYTKDTVSGSESGTLSVTIGTNNVSWAQIIRVEASDLATFSFDSGVGKDTAGGSVSIVTGNVAISSGDFIIGGMVIPTDVTTPSQFSAEAFAQSGTTFGSATEISEPDSGTGNDIGGFLCYASVSSGSGTGAVTLSATAGGTTTNVRGPGFVLRIRATSVTNGLYISTSANVTAGGEATTARLTPPSGKTTGDFTTGRRWDDENGTDSIDIGSNDYTELEWILTTQSPATTSDYFDFRVYSGNTALDTYTVTPRWTIGSGATRRIFIVS